MPQQANPPSPSRPPALPPAEAAPGGDPPAGEVREELDAPREERARFLQALAHEVRNPLLAITLQARLLRRAETEEERDKAIGVLERNVERLNTLVGDLSESARSEGAGFDLRRRRVGLAWMVREAGQRHAGAAEHAGLRLEVETGPEVEVEADPRRIAQVLDNLLGNAVKFTPPGGSVRVAAAVEGAEVVVRIHDTGPGLTPEQQARLFQPFARLHPRAGKKGTGLGLYVSKDLVEQHGGRIWAESAGPDLGSTFSFALPLAPPAPDAEPGPRQR